MSKSSQPPKPDLVKYPPSKGWVAVLNHLGTYDYENDRGLAHFFPITKPKKPKTK
jgi:hypothetical protein